MQLEPLRQWICDDCGELIREPKDGWVEWLHPLRQPARKFRIVHHRPASPRGGERGCYSSAHAGPGGASSHLEHLLGLPGMVQMLRWLDHPDGVADPSEWAELYRRLHLPYYEEAHRSWTSRRDDLPAYEDFANGFPVVQVAVPADLQSEANAYREHDPDE